VTLRNTFRKGNNAAVWKTMARSFPGPTTGFPASSTFRRRVSANQQSHLVMWFFHTHWSPQCKQIYLPRQKNSFLGGPSFVHPSAASGIQLIETLLQCGSRINLPVLNSCIVACSLSLTIPGNEEIISSHFFHRGLGCWRTTKSTASTPPKIREDGTF